VTLAATVVSTYALDAFATAAGVLLAVSRLLDGLDHGVLLVVLAASYVFWGIGMRANLSANSALLKQTGTSTNVLSKALFGLTRTKSARTRCVAASVGYVATELVKEIPYYAGAFGATLVSDSVGAREALIFLAGANLGAAVYEYCLSRLTHVFLRRRGAPLEVDVVPAEAG
jgi:hypothetical protein